MVTSRRKLGDKGEQYATNHLSSLGFDIIERNFLRSEGEIDIIGLKDNEYYFVEVKTRSSSAFGEDFETISEEKYQRMYEMADIYLKTINKSIEEEFFHLSGFYIFIDIKKIPHIHFVEDL